MGTVTVVTGGVRSGKSAWALARAGERTQGKKTFIATAEVIDDEMRKRAETHRAERGADWQTIEEPRDLAEVIGGLEENCTAVIDCCTVWLGNVWHTTDGDESTLAEATETLAKALTRFKEHNRGEIILVTNEVGWGIVPHDAGVRAYRDAAGRMNQQLAAAADTVYLAVSGIPVKIKPSE